MAIWHNTIDCIYLANNQFKVAGDLTSQFPITIRVRILCQSSWKYGSVVNTNLDNGDTIVTIDAHVLNNLASSCEVGGATSGEYGSIPKHDHSGSGVKGKVADHQISGTSVRFEKPDRDFGEWMDLSSGPQGAQGVQGNKGNDGYQGYQGVQGDQGDVGGLTGAQGYQGAQGAQGSNGTGIASNTANDVFVIYGSTAHLYPIPGSDGHLYIWDKFVTVTSDIELQPYSSSDYLISESGGTVSIGTTALSALTTGYNDGSPLHLYLTTNDSQWNFTSPTTKDYRNTLIISDKAPTEHGGYMASSGDGIYARHIAAACLDTGRAFSGLYVAPAWKDWLRTGYEYLQQVTAFSTIETDPIRITIPPYWTAMFEILCYIGNSSSSGFEEMYTLEVLMDSVSVKSKAIDVGNTYTLDYMRTTMYHSYTNESSSTVVKDFTFKVTADPTTNSYAIINMYARINPRFRSR